MRWIHTPADRVLIESLIDGMRGNPALHRVGSERTAQILAPLLLRRGLVDAPSVATYLSPALSHLHPPELMAGLRAAVDRIEAAIERKETILIYGDYDVDGTMAVIILKTAIELCGGTTD